MLARCLGYVVCFQLCNDFGSNQGKVHFTQLISAVFLPLYFCLLGMPSETFSSTHLVWGFFLPRELKMVLNFVVEWLVLKFCWTLFSLLEQLQSVEPRLNWKMYWFDTSVFFKDEKWRWLDFSSVKKSCKKNPQSYKRKQKSKQAPP